MVVGKKRLCTFTDFPLDIKQTILLRLPAKSLLRLKLVCKSWNAIISDYEFAKSHLQQSKKSTNHHIFLWKCRMYDRYYSLVSFENGKFEVGAIREPPLPGLPLCFADGLVLLSKRSSYLLWNPSTNQKRRISRPYNFHNYSITFGFCRGSTLDDYKIVARFSGDYAVYSCKWNAWSGKKEFPFSAGTYFRNWYGGLFIDGFSFWVVDSLDGIAAKRNILYFDSGDDTFKLLQLPEYIHTGGYGVFSLTSLKGCLCLYYLYGAQDKQLRIWMLKDNNVDSNLWSEFMIIEDCVAPLPKQRFRKMIPQFFTEKNKLVMSWDISDERSAFRLYNSMESKFEEELRAAQSSIFSMRALTIPLVDSLFFPA